MRKIYLLLPVLFVIVSLNAQKPGCDGSRYLDNNFATVKKSTVVYAPTIGHLGQNINLQMDVYEPDGDTLAARPVVILAHGGSFILGDKSNMQRWCELLAKKGYVAASIQYRLYPFLILGLPDSLDIFDTAVKATGDMKAAVRYFREDAATANLFRADSENIFIGGYSAGAVTALHTAYLGEDDEVPAFLQTMINANGGLEGISGTATNKTYDATSGAVINMSGGMYRSHWVDGTEPPLVSVHGTADATVPYTFGLAANIAFLEGSSLVHAQANAVGLWNNLLTVPGAGHTNLYDQPAWQPYMDTFWVNTTTLLESIVCATSSNSTEPVSAEPWAIFPNPSSGAALNIQFPESATSTTLLVFDLAGRIVFQQHNVSNQQPIRLNQLPKGTYLAQMVQQGKRFEPKVLVVAK